MSGATTLTGTLLRWQEHGDTGWGRGTLEVLIGPTPSGARKLTVVGVIRGARPGDSVEVRGTHESHPRFGDQFKVTEATVTIPQTDDGVVAWMVSNFPSVGEKRARVMLDHFGGPEALWKVIEASPERLTEVAGLTRDRAVEIQDAYVLARADREHAIVLRSWGMTDNQIGRCMMVFGRKAEDVARAIREDPFALFRLVRGFGWYTTDAIAKATGVARDDPRRVRAALKHTLDEHTSNTGAVYMKPRDYQCAVGELLGLAPLGVMDAIDTALARGELVRRGGRVYAAGMERIERELAQRIVMRGGLVNGESNGHAHGGDRVSDGRPAGRVVADVAQAGGAVVADDP
jgi:exodeoxyribonuclease V alpha subunit